MPLRVKFTLTLMTLLVAGVADARLSRAEALWRMFAPVDRVESRIDGEYTLGEHNGPWLVMAATFSGKGAEDEARELVIELRQHFNLSAYLHSMTFDHSGDRDGDRIGRGLDRYGAPLRMRYQSGDQNHEFAVLVGDFPTIDDPQAQKLLDRIKTLRPETLGQDPRATSRNLAQEREYLTRLQGGQGAPPMRKAFLTRNPVLPEEYFQPKGVDNFVEKMNSGVEHSLLNCPGKYSVKIAEFRGKAILQGAFNHGRKKGRKKEPKVDPLVEAAENAHAITQFLRARGWDAYEFHDRTESYVTIGSYDQVLQRNALGKPVPIREVGIVVRTFGAAYETPTALSVGSNVPAQDRVRAEQVKQQFSNLFSNEQGQVTQGLQPKYIEYIPGKFVPLDVHPEVIEAPKRSVTSAYAWRR
ncbi:MAG: hypothetical protein ACR2NU_14950 [Aeoliella sp.]